MQGKVGCAQCIVGATIIVLHAPEQTAVKTIQEFKHFMIQPIFLTWMVLIIAASLVLILKAGPRWGKEHMMVYIGVCSLIGSLSVVSTQGLGAAIIHNISTGESQFDNWFIYFVIVFMVVTLLTEINYLNKALNLFNTAMVTPTYYVTFTSTTIITSAILYQGFAASVVSILTVCLGFLVICGGVLLLQTSKPVVPLHIPGSSTAGIVVGTITYDDIEPTAADMRASPFSSIRRITRDFSSSRPSASVVGHSSVFQSSPLNPRAESLLQRKRRASNAAAQQAQAQAQANGHLRSSRPVSMISNTGLLTVPSGTAGTPSTSSVSSAAVASASGIATATAGITSAFYPSAAGPYSTMVLGPNGAQIRLQLCEIVVSDEKNETSRYQVYRPIPEDQLLPLPHPQSLLTHRNHSSSMAVPAGGGSVFAALNQYNSLSYKQQQQLAAPRGGFLTDSRSSSIRFQDPSTWRPSGEETMAAAASAAPVGENGGNKPSSKPESPISGSLFVPPKLSLVPPTPSPTSTASSSSVTATVTSSTPTSPISTAPTTGPLVPGGSFFTRPPNRFRSASSASARTTATTGTNGGGDIMEMNDPGHLGRPVLVSIEPVQQQPLYSLYVPPPSTSTLTTTAHPHLGKKSHPPLSPSAALAVANALHSSNGPGSHHEPGDDDSNRDDGDNDDDDDDDDDSDDKENGDGDPNETASDLLGPSLQDAQKEEDDEEGRRALSEGKPKRKNVFLRLFQRPSASQSPSPSSSSPSVAGSPNRKTNGSRTAELQQQQRQQQQTIPPPPIPFHRTNHPTTRISEGEEEEDPEDMNISNLKK